MDVMGSMEDSLMGKRAATPMKGAVGHPVPATELSENLKIFDTQTIVAVRVANRIQHPADAGGRAVGFQRHALEK